MNNNIFKDKIILYNYCATRVVGYYKIIKNK